MANLSRQSVPGECQIGSFKKVKVTKEHKQKAKISIDIDDLKPTNFLVFLVCMQFPPKKKNDIPANIKRKNKHPGTVAQLLA